MPPLAVGHQPGKGDHRMVAQVRRGSGRAVLRQILRACHQNAMHRTQPFGNQPRLGQLSDANGQIHAFLDQIDHPVEQKHRDRHTRMRHQKAANHRPKGGTAKRHRRGHRQMPLRRGCLSHRLTLCGVKITKHAPRHRRRRQVQAPCRTRKAARLCHSDEHLNLVQTVHQLFLSTE